MYINFNSFQVQYEPWNNVEFANWASLMEFCDLTGAGTESHSLKCLAHTGHLANILAEIQEGVTAVLCPPGWDTHHGCSRGRLEDLRGGWARWERILETLGNHWNSFGWRSRRVGERWVQLAKGKSLWPFCVAPGEQRLDLRRALSHMGWSLLKWNTGSGLSH